VLRLAPSANRLARETGCEATLLLLLLLAAG
jgi:hypothetical protein